MVRALRGALNMRVVAALLGAALSLLVLTASAQAATIPVTSTNDATPAPPGSLRAAIEAANAAPNPDVVDATGLTGTINLQTALPLLVQDVEIRGPGAAALTVRRDAAGAFRIFQLIGITAEISGLTIANGRSADSIFGGAGVFNNGGTLTLRNTVVAGNQNAGTSNGADGGGIFNRTASPASPATVTIVDSAVSGNTATGKGGGIFNSNSGTVMVIRSTLSGNASQGGAGCPGGGAIRNQGALTVANSTVTGNSDPVLGGGIQTCSTSPSSTTIVNSTVASNNAPQAANVGVIGDPVNAITTRLRSTILSDARGGGDNCQIQDQGILTSQGYNLADDASCNLTATADQPNTSPLIAPLANNGGPTRTMALAANSPAIDKGIRNGLTVDQRGFTRPVDFPQILNAPGGDGTDIGAFEVQTLPPLPPQPPPPPEPSNEFEFGKVKKNKRKGTAKLTVNVPGAGDLDLAKTKKVKGAEKRAPSEGSVKLKVKPKGKARQKLADKGKAKVKAEVTYTPDGGDANTKHKRIRLARAS
jgi:hypothetical protein